MAHKIKVAKSAFDEDPHRDQRVLLKRRHHCNVNRFILQGFM